MERCYGLTKRERFLLYPVLIGLFVFLAFYDLPITQALYDPRNAFGRIFEFLGEQPFQFFAVLASALLFRLRDRSTLWKNILFGVLFAILAIFFTGYGGGQFYSYSKALKFAYPEVLFVVVLLLYLVVAFAIAYILPIEDPKDIIAFCLGVVLLYLFIWLVMTGLKTIWQRPRWRYLLTFTVRPEDYFVPVWMPSPSWPFRSDFASFPSGHTMNAVGTLCLTVFFSQHFKIGKPIYYRIGAYLWTALVALSRIIVGAHFASDVTMGFLLGVLLYDLTYTYLVPHLYSLLNKKKTSEQVKKAR